MTIEMNHSASGTRTPRKNSQLAGDLKVVPQRHHGRTVFAVIVLLLLAQVIFSFATNPYINWEVVRSFLLNGGVITGLITTIEITALSIVFGLAVAVAVACMRLSASRIVSGVAAGYVFLFRGLPLVVLLIFVGNMGLFIKQITIGVPGTSIVLYSEPTQSVVTPFVASVIGLSVAASAYMSEIVRGGMLSINRGQHQAAKAIGLNGYKSMRYVILPQALRVIVPPMGNEVINTLKASALVSVIAGGDLLTVTQSIAGANYKVIELMIVASIWYMAVITALSIGQFFIERRTAER